MSFQHVQLAELSLQPCPTHEEMPASHLLRAGCEWVHGPQDMAQLQDTEASSLGKARRHGPCSRAALHIPTLPYWPHSPGHVPASLCSCRDSQGQRVPVPDELHCLTPAGLSPNSTARTAACKLAQQGPTSHGPWKAHIHAHSGCPWTPDTCLWHLLCLHSSRKLQDSSRRLYVKEMLSTCNPKGTHLLSTLETETRNL